MRKALALVTVLLLLAAPWTLSTAAQEDNEATFGPDLGAELATFGRQYVENLVLYSGAGVDMVWAPAYDGNATKLAERISEIESWAGGSVPAKATPVVVPFREADPGFAGEAPLNHSLIWSWNGSALDPTVDAVSVAKTVIAEATLAEHLLSTGDANDSAEGALLLLAAVDAVMFVGEHLGYNGSSMMPYASVDWNHSDMNASNGWWLPVTEAIGDVNGTNGAWENLTATEEESLEATLWMLRAALAVNMTIYDHSDLEGAGKPLPADSGRFVSGLASTLFRNLVALYYDAETELFWDDVEVSTGQLALVHGTLMDVKAMGAQRGQDWS